MAPPGNPIIACEIAMTEIELSKPITGHEGPVTKVVLKEPTAADYFALGEPQIVARNPDGTVFVVENDAAVKQYIERCCVSPSPLLLAQLSLRDAVKVKAAVLDFFMVARSVDTASSSSLT
jgi:hypothetical protein